MKRYWLQARTRFRCAFSVALLTIVVAVASACVPATGLAQRGGERVVVAAIVSLANDGASSESKSKAPHFAPDVTRLPFVRLVAVLFWGLVISAANLAREFRLFLGLGVFTNPYAVLFLILGMGLCGVPVTSETALSSLPYLASLGPWIADLAGIVMVLILSTIRLRPQTHSAGEGRMRDLEGVLRSNPIVSVLKNAILERIVKRMESEIDTAASRYDWDTIRVAARRALAEERTVGRLTDQAYELERKAIETFGASAEERADTSEKYETLVRLLRWCSFNRLRRGLEEAERESSKHETRTGVGR